MVYRQIGSPHPKFLAATDILIGDMSDTNYEFLLFNRPIILLANDWLNLNFSDIGIKTDLVGLKDAIDRSFNDPSEFKKQRQKWLEKTIHKPDGRSSQRVIETIIEKSGIENPQLRIITGGDQVRTANLSPLISAAQDIGLNVQMMNSWKQQTKANVNQVFIGAHFLDIQDIVGGYKVHLDHGLKGKGTANVETSREDYEINEYFPKIDLHITAGKVGQERTQMLLGPLKDRAVIAGYPKADEFIKLDTEKNRKEVFKEQDLDDRKPLVTYAPAGKESQDKPGGSYNPEVSNMLENIAKDGEYHILVKLKYGKNPFINVVSSLKQKITS